MVLENDNQRATALCARARRGVGVQGVFTTFAKKMVFAKKWRNGFLLFLNKLLTHKKNVRVQLTQSPLVIYSRESIHFSLLTVL